jgi:hypothetical protein
MKSLGATSQAVDQYIAILAKLCSAVDHALPRQAAQEVSTHLETEQLGEVWHVWDGLEASLSAGRAQLGSMSNWLGAMAVQSVSSELPAPGEGEVERLSQEEHHTLPETGRLQAVISQRRHRSWRRRQPRLRLQSQKFHGEHWQRLREPRVRTKATRTSSDKTGKADQGRIVAAVRKKSAERRRPRGSREQSQ